MLGNPVLRANPVSKRMLALTPQYENQKSLHEVTGWDAGGYTTRPVDLALLNFSLVHKVCGDMIPRSDYR